MNEASGVLTDVVGGVNQTPVNEAAFTYRAPSVPTGTYGAIAVSPAQAAAFGTGVTGSGSSLFRNNSGNNPLTGLVAPLTAMAWINPATTSARQRIISGSAGDASGWGLGVHETSNQIFTTYGRTDFVQTTGTQLQAGAWQHVAVTFDGANATFYVNGQQVDTKSGNNFNSNPNEPFALFGLPTQAADIEFFSGTIDEVRVFNTALTAPEIIANAVIPEPGTLGLLGVAGAGLLVRRRRR